MIVVAAVLTVVTAGAAAMAMGAAGSGIGGAFAAGTAALSGTLAGSGLALGALGTSMAAAAVGGFVGSVGSQLVGKGLGVVEHFSLRQAVGAGLTASFTAGAANYLRGAESLSKLSKLSGMSQTTVTNMARGAAGYLGAQASNRIAGLDTHFNWTDMAVSVVAAGITGKTGDSVSDLGASLGNSFGANFVGNMWSSAVSSSLSRLTGRGEQQDWGMMAVDAFGNALGSAAVSGITQMLKNRDDKKFRAEMLADAHRIEAEGRITDQRELQDSMERMGNEINEEFDRRLDSSLQQSLAAIERPNIDIRKENSLAFEGAEFGLQGLNYSDLGGGPGSNVNSTRAAATEYNEFSPGFFDGPVTAPPTVAEMLSDGLNSLGSWINRNQIIATEPLSGDLIHDVLATTSNTFNAPLNGLGWAFQGIGDIQDALSLPPYLGGEFAVGAMALREGASLFRLGGATNSAERVAGARIRQETMLQDNVGFNVSPTYRDKREMIGIDSAYVTDRQGLTDVIGDFSGQTSMKLDKNIVSDLEQSLGLTPGVLQGGFKIRQVDNLVERLPASPMTGNEYFLGAGNHLPGGAPEMIINPIPTRNSATVRTILEVFLNDK